MLIKYNTAPLQMRTKIKEENPTAAFGDLARLAAEGWKALSAEDRVQYDEAAAKDKERYKDEMSSYVPPSPAADEGGKKKKRKTDANAPKGNRKCQVELFKVVQFYCYVYVIF